MKFKPFHYFAILMTIFILFSIIYCNNNNNNWFKDYNQSSNTSTNEDAVKNITSTSEGVCSLNRVKRFILFNGAGVVKLVLGTTFPIILPDKKRSLNQFYNIQLQYVPPPIPLYWWSFYNTSTFAARKQRSTDMLMHYDNSRAFIYKFMETILQRSGNFGNECLLKVICEVARAPLNEDLYSSERTAQDKDNAQHGNENGKEYETENAEDYGRNIYHKLINAIFIPRYSNVDERYINAREAGLNGANCGRTFGKCPLVDGWLKSFTRFM